MRQRVGLAQALIGRPALLVLDEPTSGLDPVSRRDFYDLLDDLAADGAAILLSSHALTEVEARTDRLCILSGGKMVAEGSLQALRREAALPISMQITALNGYDTDIMAALPHAIRVENTLHLTCAQSDKLATLARISAIPWCDRPSRPCFSTAGTASDVSAKSLLVRASAVDAPPRTSSSTETVPVALAESVGRAELWRRGFNPRRCSRPRHYWLRTDTPRLSPGHVALPFPLAGSPHREPVQWSRRGSNPHPLRCERSALPG